MRPALPPVEHVEALRAPAAVAAISPTNLVEARGLGRWELLGNRWIGLTALFAAMFLE